MGQAHAHEAANDKQRHAYLKALLRDVEALELMLNEGMIESGIRRIGAEQEVALIDKAGDPAPIAALLLDRLPSARFTHELGRFNLEINLDPINLGGHALRKLEHDIHGSLAQVRAVGKELGAVPLLTGILPTLRQTDLTLENITDQPRYHAMNAAMTRLRGGPYELNISGADDLIVSHDNIMLESCNTSFQIHFQVDPERFSRWYNFAQVALAPTIAASVNSPLLFGRRLWRETRIALFQQSLDMRGNEVGARQFPPRVTFGAGWSRCGVLEIYQEDIARFKPLFHDVPEHDPIEQLQAGEIPELAALRLFNGTVYRWNRACYGISDGKPHLRIENRVLPSGPTPIDEVANAAFWMGLVRALYDSVKDVTTMIDYDDMYQSFLAAARNGLDSQLHWLDGEIYPAHTLILEKLAPMARDGLAASGILAADIDRYMSVIEERVRSRQTGATWMLKSLASAELTEKRAPAMARLTSAIAERQASNLPVHTWAPLDASEFSNDSRRVRTVEQLMTTELFTVQEDDIVGLVSNMMNWKHLRHIPVEDSEHRLVGLVTHRTLIGHARRLGDDAKEPSETLVSEIMKRDVITVTPETPSVDALRLMRESKVDCLPVLDNGKLVGIVTGFDFMKIAEPLLERFLEDG